MIERPDGEAPANGDGLHHHAARMAGLEQRVAQLEWLRDVGRRVNMAPTLDEALDVVYDSVREGLGYDRVGITLFDLEQGLFAERRGTDAEGRAVVPADRAAALARKSLMWEMPHLVALLQGADYYYTADAYAETPAHLRHLLDGKPAHSLSVVLRSGATTSGLITVDNLLSGRPITPDAADPLLALAGQVGMAVENARLREQEQTERAHLEILLESARALNATFDSEQILRVMVVRLVAALDASGAAFVRVDTPNRLYTALAHHAATNRPPLFSRSDPEPLDRHPALAHALQARTPLYRDVDDPDTPAAERAYLRGHELCAELLVPVAAHGDTNSILNVYWEGQVAVTPRTVALCTAMAEQTALALENARLYAQAAARAEQDALTGLVNHRALVQRLDAALANETHCALLLIDVDNFKLFNDTHGHLTGDAVLMLVAGTLRDVCRDDDVAGRYGGDEFALLLHNAAPEDATAVARRLAATVQTRTHTMPDGTIIPLSISVGWACYPTDGYTRQELMAVADRTMYEAKRRAGSRFALDVANGAYVAWPDTYLRDATDVLGTSPFGVLEGLVTAVDAKDRYTREHSDDVTQLALIMAETLGLSDDERRALSVAGPLHDVGKVAVPDRILRKPGKLTAEEYRVIKSHVSYGVAFIRGMLDDPAVLDAVAYHHERWDGAGYPYGALGSETPLLGRIMQLADAVSAMMLDRPYRQGLPWRRVLSELRKGAGSQFDPTLVDAFLTAVTRRDTAAS